MALLLVLLFQQAFAFSAPPEPGPSSSASWSNFRSAVNQQIHDYTKCNPSPTLMEEMILTDDVALSLQTVLVSIEERLRALDTLYSPRYTPRWEISIEQQSRRMETIESRLSRLETLLELRLDKLSETLSARQLKEELSKDQINRKIDSTYERLNHRLGYLEARLDVGIAKLQSTIDTGVGRIERMETTAVGRQGEIETELTDIGSGIHEVKKRLTVFEERYNTSLLAIVENGKHMATEMNNLTTRMEDLHYDFNRTKLGNEQNDDEGIDTEKNINMIVEKITNGIDKHANNFITKANNMYNDMWRRTQQLEGLAKDTMSLSNATRRELQEGIRTIAVQMGRRGLFQSDRERQEGSMDLALDTLGLIQRRLNELGRKFDSNFQMLMLAQNLFLESCHRIQLDEPQMEAKLTRVLERILDTITNRSINTDHEVKEILDLLKSHSAHMTRSIGHTTNTILQSSEKSSQLQIELLSVKEQLLEGNKYIEDAISDIREEKLAASEKLDSIATTLQEVQDSVAEVARASKESHKFRVSGCPDSEQIAKEILAEIQRKQLKPLMNNTEFEDTDEGFGEETENENDFESGHFQVVQEKENITENNVNTSLMENTSAFQLQHRFDVQTSRSDDVNGTPQVMIEIIPDRTSYKSNRTEDELEQVVRDPEESLFGFDLENIAAIIHDTDSGEDEEKQKPILAIVHTILQTGENNTHIKHNLDGTYSQINLNTEVNTIPKSNSTNKTLTQNHFINSEFDQSSLETSTYIPMIFVGENKMLNKTYSNDTNPIETVYQTQIITKSKHTNSTDMQESTSEIKNTSSSEQYTDVQMSVLLKKIMELYSHDERHNSTVSNMWRTFVSKFQNHNTTLTNNELNFTEVNNLAGKPFSVDSDVLQTLTLPLNDTENTEHQQHLARLQELQTELMAPSNITNHDTEEMLDR